MSRIGLTSLLLMAAALVFQGPALLQAQTASCQFVLGFKTLHDAIPDIVGDCTDNQTFAANGDASQHTTNGLLVWRKADNWTAFTDGFTTYVNGPDGIQSRPNTQRFSWEANPDNLAVATPSAVATTPAANPTPQRTSPQSIGAPANASSNAVQPRVVIPVPTATGVGPTPTATAAAVPTVASGTIAGQIVDSNGAAPTTAIQVDLFDAHGDCNQELVHDTTNGQGMFSFTGAPVWDGTQAHNTLYVIVVHKTPAQIASSTFGTSTIGCGSGANRFAMYAIGTMGAARGGSGSIKCKNPNCA